jgi:hypothetical protein
MSHVARNIRVAGAKENTFGQRSLSNMQIARLALFEVNEKKELLEKEPALRRMTRANLPLDANVATMTVMATKMPFIDRG